MLHCHMFCVLQYGSKACSHNPPPGQLQEPVSNARVYWTVSALPCMDGMLACLIPGNMVWWRQWTKPWTETSIKHSTRGAWAASVIAPPPIRTPTKLQGLTGDDVRSSGQLADSKRKHARVPGSCMRLSVLCFLCCQQHTG